MSTVPEIIVHYQKSIEKSENNRPRLLHCIAKLYKLQITVQHLQETGIGRTVNSLRKDEGEVGVAAKALVAKWKAMVAAEESSDEEQMNLDDDDDKSRSPPAEFDPKPKIVDQELQRVNESKRNGHKERTHSDQQEKHKEKSSTSATRHRSRAQSPSSGSKNILKSFDFLKPTENEEEQNNQRLVNGGHAEKSHSSSHKNHHHKSSSSSHRTEAKEHHKSTSKAIALDQKNTTTDEKRHTHHTGSSSSSSSSEMRKSNKSTHSDNKDDQHKSRSSSSKHKLDDGTAKSASKHDHHSKHASEEVSDKSKRKRESGKSKHLSSEKLSVAKKVKIEEPSEVEIDCSMGTSFADALGMMMPSSSKAAKQKATQKVVSPAIASSSNSNAVASSSADRRSSAPKDEKRVEKPKVSSTPSMLSSAAQLVPLDKDLSLELPTISNDYRPMPLNPVVMDCVFKNSNATSQAPIKRFMTDEELGASMSSKTMRTKVYSGVKTGAPLMVTSLHELCIRVLQKNIDALEATGGVPYDILKPVLERATPDQLSTLEHYNPYLIEDTDNLWLQHRNRKFRNQNRRELETWRDMFYRCTEEQNTRLSHLTENIKASQAIAIPLKKTKIAFVDSLVKPPRNIAKKQVQYGTERKLVATPAARVPTLNNAATFNIGQLGDTRLKVLAGTRDAAQAQGSSSMMRTKKAPLMAKTLQLLRGRLKR